MFIGDIKYIVCTTLILAGCADNNSSYYRTTGTNGEPQTEAYKESAHTSLSLSGCYINSIPAPQGSCDAEDGMILLGSFDPQKKSIIFAHGWIPEYEMGVPDFPNANNWQSAGYNTFIFRFINKASDPGQNSRCHAGGALFPIMGVAEFNCPKAAEPRVWEVDGSGQDLVTAYKEFFNQYPSYNKEVRMVGHSLGAEVVTYASYRLNVENYNGVKPKRIELIDPFVGTEFADTGVLPSATDYPIPDSLNLPNSACNESNNESIYCVMENSLNILKLNHQIGVAIYGSVSAGAFAYDFRKFFHYQSFSGNWLCGEFFWSGSPVCTVRNFSVFTAQHFFPLLAYFWSIDETIPAGGFSAKTVTSELQGPAKWLRQRDGGNYCNLQNGYKFWKEGGLDHMFGAARYGDAGLNNGYQSIAWSQGELARRLRTQLGFSATNANQCAKAISWSNDSFYQDIP